MHIAIIGLGTAGQAAAVLLAREGHCIEVFEQAALPGPVGAGFLLQPVGMQMLWRMGLLDAALQHGRRIDRLYGDTARGKGVLDIRYARLDPRMFGLGLQRGALFSILASAMAPTSILHADCRIVDVHAERGRLRDAAGKSHGPFDLILIADGAASSLRGMLGKPRMDRPYPWGALWCLLEQADWPHSDELRQRYVGARKMIGMLPVGTRPDDSTARISFFWSLRADQFADWAERGMDSWLDEVDELWPEAHARMNELREPGQLRRAIYRDAIPRSWFHGRAVLLGDAAHAMSPQLGQGVNMALLDAMALCDALRSNESATAALAAYAGQRKAHVSAYQFWSRWLTPLFQSEHDIVARVRDWTLQPMGRMWGTGGLMLRVLSGTQRGWFGKVRLDPAFMDALAR